MRAVESVINDGSDSTKEHDYCMSYDKLPRSKKKLLVYNSYNSLF